MTDLFHQKTILLFKRKTVAAQANMFCLDSAPLALALKCKTTSKRESNKKWPCCKRVGTLHRHLNVLVPSECQYIALSLKVRPPLENLAALTPQVTHLISNPGTVGLEHQQRCSSHVGNNHFCFLPLCCHLMCLPKKDRFW